MAVLERLVAEYLDEIKELMGRHAEEPVPALERLAAVGAEIIVTAEHEFGVDAATEADWLVGAVRTLAVLAYIEGRHDAAPPKNKPDGGIIYLDFDPRGYPWPVMDI